MNDQLTAKTAIIKTLAIIGFFAVLVLLAWLLVQGVRMAPEKFASLASIIESLDVYRSSPELTVATEKNIVNSGESFKLSWTDLKESGTYNFSYTCTEGVTLTVRGGDGELVPVACTEKLSLPGTVTGLFVMLNSQKQRFTDVPLIIAFEKEGGEVRYERTARMTVVNATVPMSLVNETVVTEETAPIPVKEEPEVTPTPKPATPVVKPAVTIPPQTAQVITVSAPVSSANGFTDLKMSFIGIGTMDGTKFTPVAVYDNDKRGGVKFEVKNIGTKTSGTWTFTTVLPSGVTYTSEPQVALKPNERVEFTLGFNFDADTIAKTAKIVSTVFEKNDTNKVNDSFSWAVAITD